MAEDPSTQNNSTSHGSGSGSSHKHRSSHSSSSHRHHSSRGQIAGANYNAQKDQVDAINLKNLSIESFRQKQITYAIALSTYLLTILAFLAHILHTSGSRRVLAVFYFAILVLITVITIAVRFHCKKVYDLSYLIQFEESRIESLKTSLVQRDKKLSNLKSSGASRRSHSRSSHSYSSGSSSDSIGHGSSSDRDSTDSTQGGVSISTSFADDDDTSSGDSPDNSDGNGFRNLTGMP